MAVALAAAAAGPLAAGCSQYSGTTAQRVQEWASDNHFFKHYDLVLNDIQRVHLAIKKGTVLQLRTICGGMASDVGTADNLLPTPDVSLTNVLNDAEVDFVNASTACSGTSSFGSQTTKKSLAQINAGLADLAKAQRLLAGFGVDWKVKSF